MNKQKLIKELEAASASSRAVADRARTRILTEELTTAEMREMAEIMHRHMAMYSQDTAAAYRLSQTAPAPGPAGKGSKG